MRNRIALLFTIICLFFLPPIAARADTDGLVVDLASDHIDVTAGFSGSSIEIFGDRRDKDTHIAIVVEGPRRRMAIWQKQKVLGTWVNRHYVEFRDIPAYYNYAVSRTDFTDRFPNISRIHRIGLDGITPLANIKKSGGVTDVEPFRQHLLESRKSRGYLPESAGTIKFLNEHFFRVSFKIPPSVPTGDYKIHSYLIKDSKVVTHNITELRVEQVGVNAFILRTSREYALFYALFCIIVAAGSGWVVSILRVRI